MLCCVVFVLLLDRNAGASFTFHFILHLGAKKTKYERTTCCSKHDIVSISFGVQLVICWRVRKVCLMD